MEGCIGQVTLWAGLWVPEGWALCDGSTYQIGNGTAALYSVLGAKYGGDGKTTFALPKLMTAPGAPQYIICVRGDYPVHP
jgi:microcystin-dependent protein